MWMDVYVFPPFYVFGDFLADFGFYNRSFVNFYLWIVSALGGLIMHKEDNLG